MHTRRLGRTGLQVSAFGLGTGGGSDPLGQQSGRPISEMVDFIRTAFDLGINYFDTAPGYMESEVILGQALQALPRDEVVVSTKVPLAGGMPGEPLQIMDPAALEANIDRSLQRLQLDHLDVLLVAVADDSHFDMVMSDQMPVLEELKRKGKVRHLGSSEQTRSDGAHSWLRAILPTGLLDVAMVGHNMFNQSAQRTVFPICRERDIGVVNVFTVRRLFSEPARLTEVTRDLQARSIVDESLDPSRPLDWLIGDGKAATLIEAAYRFALFTPGVTSVMTGTIDQDQLRQNIALVDKGPLPAEDLDRLEHLFAGIDEPMGN